MIQLEIQENLEYFGFNNILELNENSFKCFYFDNKNNLKIIVKNIDFYGELNSIKFGNKICEMLFSFLKRHSFWNRLIREIKNEVIQKDKSLEIWQNEYSENTQINNQFFIHFLLASSSNKLKYFILKSIRDYLPIPLYIHLWKDNFIKENIEVMDNIKWINFENFVISSINADESEPIGSSILLNEIFFTNFEINGHKICKTPEIQLIYTKMIQNILV